MILFGTTFASVLRTFSNSWYTSHKSTAQFQRVSTNLVLNGDQKAETETLVFRIVSTSPLVIPSAKMVAEPGMCTDSNHHPAFMLHLPSHRVMNAAFVDCTSESIYPRYRGRGVTPHVHRFAFAGASVAPDADHTRHGARNMYVYTFSCSHTSAGISHIQVRCLPHRCSLETHQVCMGIWRCKPTSTLGCRSQACSTVCPREVDGESTAAH